MTQYTKPAPGDYAEYFAGYLEHLANDQRDVLVILQEQGEQVRKGLQQISDQKANHRYAPDKWSVKEVIGHLIDMERLFAFRAFWIARGADSVQPGVDENQWADNNNAHTRLAQDIWDEHATTRSSNLCLFRSIETAILSRTGLVDGTATAINAFPWLIAAHERHHLLVLRDLYEIDFLSLSL